jgi:hypothetical protein
MAKAKKVRRESVRSLRRRERVLTSELARVLAHGESGDVWERRGIAYGVGWLAGRAFAIREELAGRAR